MDFEPTAHDLELLATDAFRAFGRHPNEWPDVVQFNRSGTTDVNIRGIWSFEDRVEFYHVPFQRLEETRSEDLGTSPESSGVLE